MPEPSSCPGCDAPVAPGARVCAGCGYELVAGERGRRPRPELDVAPVVAAAVAAVAVLAVALVALLDSGEQAPEAGATLRGTAEVVSAHPLSTRAAEAALEDLYISMRDDDSASARCGERVPRPAHSVRRCWIRYPDGTMRRVVLLTNARGDEVLSEP